MRTIFIFIVFAVVAVPLAAGCGSDEEETGLEIVATTGIAADLARQVAGESVTVEQLIPDSASPHDFQLSAEDRQKLEEAELVVSVGAGLEAGVPLEEVGSPRWALAANAGRLLALGDHPEHEGTHAEEGGAEAEGEEDQAEGDPHVWMDPTRVAAAMPSLGEAIAGIDPEAARTHRRRAMDYVTRLRSLDRRVVRMLDAIPPADRELITSHDSLGYFAERYGFEVRATVFPASGPEAETSAAGLAELVDAIDTHDVPAVFAQREDDPGTLAEIAEQEGIVIEDGLAIESPGSVGDYPSMLLHDAKLIASALSPRQD